MYWLCLVPVGAPAFAGTDNAADITVTAMQSAYVPACHDSSMLLRGRLQPLRRETGLPREQDVDVQHSL